MSDETNKNGSESKVEFTPEQQEKVNEFINKAVGRATASVREEYSSKIDGLTSELNAAKEAAKNATTANGKKEAKEDVAALQAQIDEMKNASKSAIESAERWKKEAEAKAREVDAAKQEAQGVRKDVAIANAASKAANFVDLEVVKKLTSDAVKMEDGKWVVLNEAGQVRLNAAMEPMTLNEFYNDYAAKNPYLVRGDVKPGTGSSESMRSSLSNNGKFEVKQVFGKDSSAVLAQKLMKENPAEYRRLKGVAKEAGLI